MTMTTITVKKSAEISAKNMLYGKRSERAESLSSLADLLREADPETVKKASEIMREMAGLIRGRPYTKRKAERWAESELKAAQAAKY